MGRDLAQRTQQRVAERTDNAPAEREKSIYDDVRDMEKQFALAMPKGAEATQLVRDAITCIRATPKLLECERMSVLGSLMTCAQLGLRPGVGVLGHAYLLPFWDGKSRSHKAQLVIGYQGYVELAYRSGKVKSIAARTVYTNDVFEIEYGAAEDRWVHKPCIDGPRGEPRLFYAVGRTVDGGYYLTDPMTVADMERYRDKHATARRKDGVIFGPWVDHFEGMAQKTMVRKLMKLMPKSTELVRAIAQDDGVRLNVSPDAVDREPVFVEPEPEPVDAEVEPILDPPADQVEVELITDAQAKELTTALIKAGYSSVSDRLEWLRSTLFNPDLRDVAELSRVQAVEALAVLSGAAK